MYPKEGRAKIEITSQIILKIRYTCCLLHGLANEDEPIKICVKLMQNYLLI